jgi:predicted RNase H-like nuclease (RuvC/YqgF family)
MSTARERLHHWADWRADEIERLEARLCRLEEAMELRSRQDRRRERREQVIQWLRFFLETGPRTSAELYAAAEEVGFKRRELQGAERDAAGVELLHPEPTGPWYWRLKTDA